MIAIGRHRKHRIDPLDDATRKRIDELYDSYLDGDLNQARHSLDEIIQIGKEMTPALTFDKHDWFGRQARVLYIEYERLYALEERSGNHQAAELILFKAKCWGLCLEEQGKDIERSSLKKQKEALDYLSKFDPKMIIARIDLLDKNCNKGQLPRYVRELGKGQPGHP